MVFGSVNTLLFIAWHFDTTSAPRKRERNIWYLFCPCTPYGSRVSLTGEEEEEEEERRKKNYDFNFFNIRFLSFYKAEQKQMTHLYSEGVRAFHRSVYTIAT